MDNLEQINAALAALDQLAMTTRDATAIERWAYAKLKELFNLCEAAGLSTRIDPRVHGTGVYVVSTRKEPSRY